MGYLNRTKHVVTVDVSSSVRAEKERMLVVEIFFKKKYMNLMYRYQHCSCIRTETLLDYRGVYKSNKNWRWPQLASHASGGHRPTITCMHPIAAAQQTRAF